MNRYDEELAALLALDALESAGRADAEAEAELDGAAADLQRVGAVLAEAVATAPPEDLRARVLETALNRRVPGRAVGELAPCPPAEAFRRTIADVARLLHTLTDDEWLLPAHEAHGPVRNLVGHLVGVERLSERWLRSPDVPAELDHVAATRPVIDELASVDGPGVARAWHEAALRVAAAAEAGNPGRAVQFHDLRADVSGFLVIRTFELWAHSMDISVATARPLLALDDERMLLLSQELMRLVPAAVSYRGGTAPRGTIRFVLPGRAGGCYDVPLHPEDGGREPAATIVAGAVELCRVAARRLPLTDVGAVIDGDERLAWGVLGELDALARD